ncbi:MAG TPA: hypothetical protein VI248_15835 [Kineosporiaceae bacterium]
MARASCRRPAWIATTATAALSLVVAIAYDSFYGLVLASLGVADPAVVPGALPARKPVLPLVGA